MAGGTLDGDGLSRDGDHGAIPFLVTERCGSLEGDGSSLLESREIEGCAGRDGDAVEDNAGAASLATDGTGGSGEGAAGTFVENRGSVGRGGQKTESGRKRGD